MLKLKALLLSQGMHGMISQVEGLAKALNLDFKHQTIKLKNFWNLIPPKLTPISNLFFNPSKDSFFNISSALPPFSELIFGKIGFENNGLKLHLKGKL